MDIKKIIDKAQKNRKKIHLSATISYELKTKLDELAKKNGVSLSTLIEAILEETIKINNTNS